MCHGQCSTAGSYSYGPYSYGRCSTAAATATAKCTADEALRASEGDLSGLPAACIDCLTPCASKTTPAEQQACGAACIGAAAPPATSGTFRPPEYSYGLYGNGSVLRPTEASGCCSTRAARHVACLRQHCWPGMLWLILPNDHTHAWLLKHFVPVRPPAMLPS